jgi:hypothetical protein
LTFFAAAKASSSFPPPDLPEIAFAGQYFKLSPIFYACFILVKTFSCLYCYPHNSFSTFNLDYDFIICNMFNFHYSEVNAYKNFTNGVMVNDLNLSHTLAGCIENVIAHYALRLMERFLEC